MQKESVLKEKNRTIEELSINAIRILSAEAVEKAKSGHPGLPMGMAAVGYVLWTQFLKHNPKNPNWPNRDRFVLSAGHGSVLLYTLLYLCGYPVTLEDLKKFRQWGSITPGHPEYGETVGVETTTGPLGQGISTAVGMAIGQRYLNGLFKTEGEALLTHKIYGIASDGDMMEGITSEASSLAGHLGLSSLIFFYDDNHITIDGKIDLALSEDVGRRFEAYHWNVLKISDANNLSEISLALNKALEEKERPTLIITRSHIGFGSPHKVDSEKAHGEPLGTEELKLTKNLGWPLEPEFYVPNEVKTHFREKISERSRFESIWNTRFDSWKKNNPEPAALWDRLSRGELPKDWEKKIPDFAAEEKISTRAASGKILNALAPVLPELLGGSADLAGSNNTLIKGFHDFSKMEPGRNFHFGIREHAMAASLNGMALTNMLIPYGGTFLIFTDYMKGAMRISALLKKRVIYILTHDSIGLGEDGPTHQPIEQLAHLRATPNMTVIRPADATETAVAWAFALRHKTGPVSLVLTRQNLPVLSKNSYPTLGQVEKGAYALSDSVSDISKIQIILIATGSEVALALAGQKKLLELGINSRVVSMPSMEIFEAQTPAYQESVLPSTIRKRLSIEALSTFGWAKYVGLDGRSLGMTSFGASAPGPVLMEKFGFTVANIVSQVKSIIS